VAEAKAELEETQELLKSATEGNDEDDENMQAKLQALQDETVRLQAALEDAKQDSVQYQETVAALKQKMMEERAEDSKPAATTTSKQAVKDETEEDANELQLQLSAKSRLLEQNQKLIKLLHSKAERLEDEGTSLRKQLEESSHEQAKREQEATISALKEELEEAREELQLASAEVQRCRSKVSELESQIANDDLVDDKVALQSAMDEIEFLRQQLSNKRDREETETDDDDDDDDDDDEVEIIEEPEPKKPRGNDDDSATYEI